ncbi:Coiled-coil and C2 domain-containing protein 1-like [Nymphon striatum]|nr:Coiled-coil and C2 domain-containing protein 1-like [Nymphon striatum]
MFTNAKKTNKQTSDGHNRSLAQLGLMDIPNVPNDMMDEDGDDDDDDDLEAELAAMIAGEPKPKAPPRRKPQSSLNDIKKMTDACMKDDISDDEEEIDENDLELLSVLKELASTETDHLETDHLETTSSNEATKASSNSQNSVVELQQRLESYLAAEKAAHYSGDTNKARRYNRAAKTLNEQIKMVNAGKLVPEEEIPPSLHGVISKPQDQNLVQIQKIPENSIVVESRSVVKNSEPVRNEDSSSKVQAMLLPKPEISEDEKNHQILVERRDQYKKAALVAKSRNDKETAIKYIGIMKQFDSVIAALANGQPIDLSKMPSPPSVLVSESHKSISAPTKSTPLQSVAPTVSESTTSQFIPPATPASVLEALNQRLEKFKATADAAKQEGNNSKARRIGRIVKQYNAAIKDYTAGKMVDMEELPAPPGCPPMPKEGFNLPSASNSPDQNSKETENSEASKSLSDTHEEISPTKKVPAPMPPSKSSATTSPPTTASTRPVKRSLSGVAEKQLQYLLQRQKYFKMAALESKKTGDMDLAMDYLKTAKGIEPMIEAARCGLPVDIKTIPTPPQLKEDFVIIDHPSTEKSTGDSAEMYATLDQDLLKQLKLCLSNKEMFTKLGDIASASRFENYAIDTKRDIQVIRNNIKRNDPVPKFHYETRTFSIVQCNPTLNDNDMELTIIRGINLPGTKDLDTFVRCEFPQPSETPQTNKTSTIKDTTQPGKANIWCKYYLLRQYSSSLSAAESSTLMTTDDGTMSSSSTSNNYGVVFGFFSSDALIGTIKTPLNILESKCQVHDSYEIYDGRKPCGGKLEIKIKLKEPLLRKQVETLKERWLVIGS